MYKSPVQLSNITALVRLSNITALLLAPYPHPELIRNQQETKVHKGTIRYIKISLKLRRTWPGHRISGSDRVSAACASTLPAPLTVRRESTLTQASVALQHHSGISF